jgi:RimJ/RimL family protein N-acetyltransferase
VSGALSFIPLDESHLPLMARWRAAPHVAEWFHGALTEEQTRAKYLPRIRGEEPSHGFVVLLDGAPLGFIQRYRAGDEDGLPEILDVDPDAHGLDVFIGDETLLNRGLGTRIVREFSDLVLQEPSVAYLIIDPDTENAAAIACYRRAGFTPLRETPDLLDPSRRSLLMERRREQAPD